MNWHDVFYYDNGILRWKRSYGRVKAGEPAGRILPDGYLQVNVGYRFRRVHRIVWEMFNGDIPEGMQIDHINHIRTDNRIENLRLVTCKENSKNKSRSKNNRSGVTGVYFDNYSSKWKAQIKTDNGIKHLGRFLDISDAIAARKLAEEKLGYHKNHGG